MKTLAPGTQILYTREDNGGSIQNDGETVLLRPGKPLTVSSDPDGDVTPALAARLVEDGVCRVHSLPAVEAKNGKEAKPEVEDNKNAEEVKPSKEAEQPEQENPAEAENGPRFVDGETLPEG